MTATTGKVEEFFERYAAALLARDAKMIAGLYAVPSLILFPGTSIPVSGSRQTEEFFTSAFSQYAGVDDVGRQIIIMCEAPGTVWADVTGPTAAGSPSDFVTSSLNHPRGTGSPCSR
jgi:ketosteroid isomerase-like protein